MSEAKPPALDPVDVYIGSRIRDARLQRGISQESLSGILRLSFQQIQKYERGRNRISAANLYVVADACEQPIGYFFDGLKRHAEPNGRRSGDHQVLGLNKIWLKIPAGQRQDLMRLLHTLARQGHPT